MERRQLESFLAVAEAGSFTRASSRLSIAQPSLSYSIRALERELGATLFERHGRGVRLTAAGGGPDGAGPADGALLLAGQRGCPGRVGRGVRTAHDRVQHAVGGRAAGAGDREFRRLQPGVRFVLTDPTSRSDVLDLVRSGEADLGLVDGTPPSGQLDSRWLVDHELVAVLPPGTTHRLLTVGVSELVPLGLISTPRGTAMRTLLDEQLEAAGTATEVAIETAHVASVIPLVLAGAGVAILPEGMAAEAAAKGARVVRLDPPTRASVSLVWRRDRLGAVAEHFVMVASESRSDRDA